MSGGSVDFLQEIASLERENEELIDKSKGLEGLEQKLDSFEEDRDHVQALCNEVEALEVEQATFRRLFDELSEAKEQLKHISAKYEGRLA